MVNETELKFAPGKSKISGTGNFAKGNLQSDEVITIIKGQVVNGQQLDVAVSAGELGLDDDLQLGPNSYLIESKPWCYFNHSCNPNSGIRSEREMFALRHIAAEEEITCDYSTVVGSHSKWTMQCSCGSENCRRVIGSILTIPENQLSFYKQKGALPNFIFAELSTSKVE